MNRISTKFADACGELAKEMCTDELIEKLIALDTEHQEKDAWIKGYVPWIALKDLLDYYVVTGITEKIYISKHPSM